MGDATGQNDPALQTQSGNESLKVRTEGAITRNKDLERGVGKPVNRLNEQVNLFFPGETCHTKDDRSVQR